MTGRCIVLTLRQGGPKLEKSDSINPDSEAKADNLWGRTTILADFQPPQCAFDAGKCRLRATTSRRRPRR